MTATPQRLYNGKLQAALENVQAQLVLPDEVVVSLPRGPLRRNPRELYPEDSELPRFLLKPPKRWVVPINVYREGGDHGPIQVLWGCLQRASDPTSILLSWPDDQEYSPQHSAIVVDAALQNPGFSQGVTGIHSVQGFRPCLSGTEFFNGCGGRRYWGSEFGPMPAGWLVKSVSPWHFGAEGLALPEFPTWPEECNRHDDLWISAVQALRGVRRETFNAALPGLTTELTHKGETAWRLEKLNWQADTLMRLVLPLHQSSGYATMRLRTAYVKVRMLQGSARLGFSEQECFEEDGSFQKGFYIDMVDEYDDGEWRASGGLSGRYEFHGNFTLELAQGNVSAYRGDTRIATWPSEARSMCVKLILYSPRPGSRLGDTFETVVEVLDDSARKDSTTLKPQNFHNLLACNDALIRQWPSLWRPRARLILTLVEMGQRSSWKMLKAPALTPPLDEVVRCAGHIDQWYKVAVPVSVEPRQLAATIAGTLAHESTWTVMLALVPRWGLDREASSTQVGSRSECMAVSEALRCAMASPDTLCTSKATSTDRDIAVGSRKAFLDSAAAEGPSRDVTAVEAPEPPTCWSRQNASWGLCCGPQLEGAALFLEGKTGQVQHPSWMRKRWRKRACSEVLAREQSCCRVHPLLSGLLRHWQGWWKFDYSDGTQAVFVIQGLEGLSGYVSRKQCRGALCREHSAVPTYRLEPTRGGNPSVMLQLKPDANFSSVGVPSELWRWVEGRLESVLLPSCASCGPACGEAGVITGLGVQVDQHLEEFEIHMTGVI